MTAKLISQAVYELVAAEVGNEWEEDTIYIKDDYSQETLSDHLTTLILTSKLGQVYHLPSYSNPLNIGKFRITIEEIEE